MKSTDRARSSSVGKTSTDERADGDATFRIVEPESADAVADRVSALSPLGSALLGRRAGDEVRFRAPGGVLVATVVAVEPARGEGPGDRVDP